MQGCRRISETPVKKKCEAVQLMLHAPTRPRTEQHGAHTQAASA